MFDPKEIDKGWPPRPPSLVPPILAMAVFAVAVIAALLALVAHLYWHSIAGGAA